MSTTAGLKTSDGSAIPLTGVRVDATLRGACLEVEVTQRYRNAESVPIEAVYVFPLEEGSAVCGFAALVGDEIVRGRVEEREKAFEAYDDAMMEGHGAFLLDQERPDVFTASVGNLRPGETVELQIRYVAMARREGDALRVAIPTTVSPRYVPGAASPEVGQPDGERVNPERWPSVPYGLALALDVDLGSALRRVESPSHPIRTELREGGARVELAQDDVALDRDVVILVEAADRSQPVAMVAREEDGTRVAMLTFLPDVQTSDAGHEVIFLLDCSGSMGGESIASAKKALALCVRALATGDRFDIVCFGSTHRSLWGTSRAFDDASLEEAARFIGTIDANLGGTEILAPLREILTRPALEGMPRRVLLLTDGQVSNEADVIALAGQHADRSRVFAFGIGAGASEHLVRGVSRASRGAAEMIAPGERIEPKVLRTFARVRTPALDDVRVEWGELRVKQAPATTPPVFVSDALTVFARVESGSASEVTLTAGGHRWTAKIDLEHAEPGGPVPSLWARERIRELESPTPQRGSQQSRGDRAERTKQELIALGVRYGLVSSATSYVAVAERRESDKTNAPAQLRRIPVALTDGWGGGARPAFAVGSAPQMRSAGYAGAPPPRSGAVPMAARPMAPPAAMPPGAPPPPSRPRAKKSVMGRVSDALFGAPPPPPPAASPAPRPMREAPMDMMMADAPAEASDRVFDLLMTQKADGRFERSRELDAWLGGRAAALVAAIAAHGEAIACTAIVLALLEAEAPERRSEWTPAADKARGWLAKQGTTPDGSALLSA
ncbi:MAG: VWA domain-containing protein [Sandaracinaceae bacterium]|nr:VWA domain-containing protein [Sandaracinaceae bacterium]